MKRFVYYFTCTVIIGVILYLGVRYQFYLNQNASKSFEVCPVILFDSLFPIGMGILLRIPALVMEIKEKKQWTFDWGKMMAVGLPALYVTSLPVLAMTPFGMDFFLAYETVIWGNVTMTTMTTGIVFGYILIDSLKK